MNGRAWTVEELYLLQNIYPSVGIKETAQILNRSYNSVSVKARKAGIKIHKETTSRILSTMPRKRGSKHFLWKGGISLAAQRGMAEYDYRDFKERIKYEVDFRCERCGRNLQGNRQRLDLHHKDGNKLNNNRENITVLCRKCHMRTEREFEAEGKWSKKYAYCGICGTINRRHKGNGLCINCFYRERYRQKTMTKGDRS